MNGNDFKRKTNSRNAFEGGVIVELTFYGLTMAGYH